MDVIEHPDESIDEAGQPTVDEARDEELDLGLIERDLDGVSAALERLDAGTYWTDEVTGETIPDALLVADPIARRST